jgi:hypothetical protein
MRSCSRIGRHWLVRKQNILRVCHQRVFSLIAKRPVEIININGPPHDARESVRFRHVDLDADAPLIVISDPVAVAISVWHLRFVVPNACPAIAQLLADLVVGKISRFAGERTCRAGVEIV